MRLSLARARASAVVSYEHIRRNNFSDYGALIRHVAKLNGLDEPRSRVISPLPARQLQGSGPSE
jgi:hypothetical protein